MYLLFILYILDTGHVKLHESYHKDRAACMEAGEKKVVDLTLDSHVEEVLIGGCVETDNKNI